VAIRQVYGQMIAHAAGLYMMLSVCLVSAGHLQRCDQTEPIPSSPAALLLERPAVRPHAL